jgi:hypothetical protein
VCAVTRASGSDDLSALGDRIVDSGTRGANRNERKRAPPFDKVDSFPE